MFSSPSPGTHVRPISTSLAPLRRRWARRHHPPPKAARSTPSSSPQSLDWIGLVRRRTRNSIDSFFDLGAVCPPRVPLICGRLKHTQFDRPFSASQKPSPKPPQNHCFWDPKPNEKRCRARCRFPERFQLRFPSSRHDKNHGFA